LELPYVQLPVGVALAFVLVFVAVFFGLRQRRTLGQLRGDTDMAEEERDYLTRQVRRRLFCSALLIVLAGFLLGWFFIEQDWPNLAPAEGEPLSDEAKDQVRFFVFYWIAALLVLLVILFLASWDFLATARYGFARQKQLEQERRAMLEMEAAKLRRRRQELN
jgi:hypothetical protein